MPSNIRLIVLTLSLLVLSCSGESSPNRVVPCTGTDCPDSCSAGFEPDGLGGCRPVDDCLRGISTMGSFKMPRAGVDAAVYENTLYLAAANVAYLSVVDVTDPQRAVEVNALRSNRPTEVAIHDGWLYALEDAVEIFDISDPHAPRSVATLNPPGRPSAIAFSGDLAYTVAGDAGFRVFDISDPTNPLPRGSFDAEAASDVAAQGTLAYVAAGDDLLILDVGDPANPTLEGSRSFSGVGQARSVVVAGGHAYVGAAWGSSDARIAAVDVSNPQLPVLSDTTELLDSRLSDVETDGTTLYASGIDIGLLLFDLTTPGDLGSSTLLDYPRPIRTVVDGSLAYVMTENGYIQLLDVSSPTEPTELFSSLTRFSAQDLDVFEGKAYVGTRDALWVMSVTGSGSIELEGLVELGDSARDVDVLGDVAYVALAERGLALVDVSNARSPELLRVVDTLGSTSAVSVEGSHAYVVANEDGLLIIDVANPASASIVSGFNVARSEDVVVRDGVAYLTAQFNGLYAIDVSQPTMPVELDSLSTRSGVTEFRQVTLLGDNALIEYYTDSFANPSEGIVTVDISNPANLTEVDSTTILAITDLTSDDDYLYYASVGVFSEDPELAVSGPDPSRDYVDMEPEDTIYNMAADDHRVYSLIVSSQLDVFEFEDCGGIEP